jgi:CBS domain-containing protein
MKAANPETVTGFTRQPWSAIPVDQVMCGPVLTCGADTPLRDLARTMVTHSVHAIVVLAGDTEDEYAYGVVTDLAVAKASLDGGEPLASELADSEAPTVSVRWSLDEAAREMLRTSCAHVVVIDGRGAPIGMLSTLDLARITAWGHA